MTSWQMVNCGRCRRCLTGVPSHGPYLYYHEYRGKDDRPHIYGGSGSSASRGGTAIALKGQDGPDGYAGATLDREREVARERLHAKADADYERRKANLTPAQAGKIEAVMRLVGRLRNVERRQKRETDKRIREVERDLVSRSSSGSAPPSLLLRAASHIRAEVAAQFALEVAEIKKEIKQQKEELASMLEA